MIAATATDVQFPGIDTDPSPHQRPKPRGDLAPLTLLDILPDRTATAMEPLDSWRSLGEINAGIISNLSICQATAT